MAGMLATLREATSVAMRKLRIHMRGAVQSTGKAMRGEYWFGPEEERRLLWAADQEGATAWWKVTSDKDIGGASTVEVRAERHRIPRSLLTDSPLTPAGKEETEEAQVMVMEGALDLTPPKGVANSGYAALLSQPFEPVQDLVGFDALEFIMRTDGRVYISNVKAESVVEDDLHQCFVTTKPNVWSRVVVPFNKYTLTWRGLLEYEQVLFNPARVLSLGMLAAERKSGPFRLDIRSISAVSVQRLAKRVRYDAIPFNSDLMSHAPYQQENRPVVCAERKDSQQAPPAPRAPRA